MRPPADYRDTTRADPYRLEAIADTLEDYDLAVFVSVNAVQMGLERILDQRDWPEHTQIATVGARSAEALTAYGLSVDLVPEHQFNSEALLALEELEDMSGRDVVIFRGNGGREVLRDTLLERGAEVEYVEVYRRVCPTVDAGLMQQLLQPGYLDYITITSNEALQNLFAMAGKEGQAALRQIPLVVVGERQARLAAQLGFCTCAAGCRTCKRCGAACRTCASLTQLISVCRRVPRIQMRRRRNGIHPGRVSQTAVWPASTMTGGPLM